MSKHKKKIQFVWSIIVGLIIISMVAFTILPLLTL